MLDKSCRLVWVFVKIQVLPDKNVQRYCTFNKAVL